MKSLRDFAEEAEAYIQRLGERGVGIPRRPIRGKRAVFLAILVLLVLVAIIQVGGR